MNNVQIAIWGFGAMGSGIARTLLSKSGVDLVGVCDTHPQRVGKSIYTLLGLDAAGRKDILISDSIDKVVKRGECDICVVATDSFIDKVESKLCAVLEKGVNAITLAEEMAFPKAQHPEAAKRLDDTAKKNGVSVMGTGINPGLVMDLLAICLSGCMTNVESIACKRVNSLSPFGQAVMEEQGVGLAPEEFEQGVADGTLMGHVGFAESIGMISEALGLGLDGFTQQMKPIVTQEDRTAPHGSAKAGHVAGVEMTGQGLKNGKVVVDMIHPQQIEPEQVGVHTGDYITLTGSPNVSMSITPEISGGLGTIAMCVNCIPHVINAAPGLRTMIDIPVPRAIMGDFRDFIDPERKISR